MTEPQHAAVEPANPEKSRRQGRVGLMLVIAGSALAVAIALVYNTRSNQLAVEVDQTEREKQHTEQQLDNTQEKLGGLVDRALAICQAGGPEVDKMRQVGLCEQAAEAREDPQGQSSGASFALVKAAVDAYFATHPVRDGHTPTPEELRPIIEAVFKANPPADGKTPTPEELLALIQQVYAANPPRDGRDGRDGEPCDPAVKPECQGPQGPGIEKLHFVERDGDCFIEVIFQPFEDGRRTPPAIQRVDPGLCYEPPPATSPAPSPSPSPAPSPSPSPTPTS